MIQFDPKKWAEIRRLFSQASELPADQRELLLKRECSDEEVLREVRSLLDYSDDERAMFRPVRQRLVRTHPVSGRKSLYLSSHAGGILGMPVPEARILLKDLTEHATQPKFVYVHQWRVWDLVMWDNRQMMHRVRRYDESQPRDMRRTTVAGTAATTAQV